MRGLVQRARQSDPEVAEALKIIEAFDELVAQQADLRALAAAAAVLTGCTVCVVDMWNGRRLSADASGNILDDAPPTNVLAHGLPPFGAIEVGRSLAASVQTAGGAIGAVWLEGSERSWLETDFVVAERLATGVAIDAVACHQQLLTEQRIDPGTLVQLVTPGLGDTEVQVALRRAQLRGDLPLVALAVVSSDEILGPQASGQVVCEVLAGDQITARAAVVGRSGLVIAASGPRLELALASLASGSQFRMVNLVVGVGTAETAQFLWQSWAHALQAVAFASASPAGVVVSRFEELGALALLSSIPAAQINELPDLAILRSIGASNQLDLHLLELYCELASMRTVAQRVHMHHSSVDYRLKRISRDLGFDLGTSSGRLRALLAVKLLRVARAREQTYG